ncbi:MAG: DNA gyrase subunit A [Thermotogae bacterium]|nr:DNA gyrase subunit A [Thermotogota bacterium]
MGKVLEIPLEKELKESYLDYAVSVIVGRAIPDARDGLKPVQRRILYAMKQLNLLPNRPFRKSATVVGEVIGKYHPHGDQAVYDALVRMAQDFSLRYPLIDGQGNFGSIDGDPPSAYRYTEARLKPIALEVIGEIDEDTVDFVPNFDGQYVEPVIMASRFPHLLANGTTGIAVGMATNIPPHNLGEVIDAAIALIDNPHLSSEDLLEIVKGPDFPTGGFVIGYEGLKRAYTTGHGKITIRAKYRVESNRIVITEIPYEVKKADLIKQIAELVKAGKVEGISDLRDESDKEGIRVVIELKRGADPRVVENQLLKYSNLQRTYAINMLALVGVQPRLLTLKDALVIYLQHREEVVRRRTEYRLSKALHRLEIVEGLLKAIDIMDEVIKTIREAENPSAAKGKLQEMGFTALQSQSILDMRLSSLTRLQTKTLQEEKRELEGKVRRYRTILSDRVTLLNVMKSELLEIKEKYADRRRTVILKQELTDFNMEALIKEEDVVVVFTKGGYAKRLPLRSFRAMNRRTQGKTAIKFYEDDSPAAIVKLSTHDDIVVVTDRGSVFWTKAYDIPETSAAARGRSIRNIFKNYPKDEKVVWAFKIPQDPHRYELVVLTGSGRIKRVRFDEVLRGRKGTSISREGVVSVFPRLNESFILVASKEGKGYRMKVEEVPILRRQSLGVYALRGEPLVAIPIDEGEEVIVITERGYAKRMAVEEVPILHRGRKVGVKLTSGHLFSLFKYPGNDSQAIILTAKGIINRVKLHDIPLYSRTARGVMLLKLSRDDRVVDVVITD